MFPRLLCAALASMSLLAVGAPTVPPPRSNSKDDQQATDGLTPGYGSVPFGRPEINGWGWVPRAPFHTGKVYLLKVTIGSPYYVELPIGEYAKIVSTDREYFKCESDESSRVVHVTAENSQDAIGKKGRMLIETTSGLMISLILEVVPETPMPPGGLSIYLPGTDPEVAVHQVIETQAKAKAAAYQTDLERRLNKEANRWKTEQLADLKVNYKTSKNGIDIDRVLSTPVQTFIYARKLTEIPVIKIINRDKKEEVVDAEHDNGVYTINRVLQQGEKFVLELGKFSATIQLD